MPELNHRNKIAGHSSHYEDSQEKAIPVTVAGLHGSGKTAILNCLLDRIDLQDNKQEILGLTATTIEIEQTRLRLIDLGGEEAFRDLLWETYVKIAEGLVFVVDATNAKNLDLARDWFWRIVDWGNKQAPILLLINQRDFETKTLGIDEITAQFELERFSEVPARPIRILEVSVAEEDSVRHSFGWLVEKLQARVQSQALEVRGLSFYGWDGAPIAKPVFFGHNNNLNNLHSLIEKFGTLRFAKTADLGLQTLTVGEHRIMLIKGDQVSCAILIRKSDSQERAKIVTEELIGYVEEEFIEKGKNITVEVISEFMSRKFALFLAT
ncbi:MAG: ADP-ribosylation factor-like protein [Candidatus Heimdallarchaeota archaeon]